MEVALLLPVLALVLLVILQIGLLGRDLVLVSHASREAARAAAVDPDPSAAAVAARSAGGLDPERLSVDVSGRAGPGSRVRVTVTYRADTDVLLVGTLIGDRTIRSSTMMRVETSATVQTRAVTNGTNDLFQRQIPRDLFVHGRICHPSGETGA